MFACVSIFFAAAKDPRNNANSGLFLFNAVANEKKESIASPAPTLSTIFAASAGQKINLFELFYLSCKF